MLRTPKRDAVPGFSSMLSLAKRTRPAIEAARSSIIGVMIRHGPHQAAQMSTTTGSGERSTSAAKVASVTVMGLSGAGSGVRHRPQRGRRPSARRSGATLLVAPHTGHRISSESAIGGGPVRSNYHYRCLSSGGANARYMGGAMVLGPACRGEHHGDVAHLCRREV